MKAEAPRQPVLRVQASSCLVHVKISFMGVKAGSERVLVVVMAVLGVVGVGVFTPILAMNGSSWGWIVATDVLFLAVIWVRTTTGIQQLRNREAEKKAEESRTPS